MSKTNEFTHLTLEERRIILTGISNGSTKTAIARTIGKDRSTIGKEIKQHRKLTHKCNLPLECANTIVLAAQPETLTWRRTYAFNVSDFDIFAESHTLNLIL